LLVVVVLHVTECFTVSFNLPMQFRVLNCSVASLIALDADGRSSLMVRYSREIKSSLVSLTIPSFDTIESLRPRKLLDPDFIKSAIAENALVTALVSVFSSRKG